MDKWIEAKLEAVEERGSKCEVCERSLSGPEFAHVFYKRWSGVHDKENGALVCPNSLSDCHHYMDTPNGKKWFWDVQCRRYGEAHMHAWHEGLPLISKENFG